MLLTMNARCQCVMKSLVMPLHLQEELLKSVSSIKLPIEEYAKYANDGYIFPDTTPKRETPPRRSPI